MVGGGCRHHYQLVIHGKGGPIPKTEHRYEAIPWLREEHFLSPATTFPREVHTLINHKTWEAFYRWGRGGRVHLTDPEGTDVQWTLFEEYFDSGRMGSGPTPYWGHVLAHGATPLVPQEDATGYVAGTTTHFSRPFPHMRLTVQDGRVEAVAGGNRYGDAWRDLMAETRTIHYPAFPRPGLFWLWEVAIGTNPKISRPKRVHLLTSGGFEWERRRSGIIHMGFGTLWRAPEEDWAAERGLVYGHLHVHLLFPTLTIHCRDGRSLRVIDHGHLTALDDPDVRRAAAQYGDPDVVLREDWIPEVPGITAPGSYDTYAADPAAWIYRQPE